MKYQVPPVIWAIVIYFLSAIPNVHLIFKTSPGVDKIVHAALYFILCWLVWRAFYHQDTLPVVRNSAFLGAFIFCVVYGFLDEYHRSFVPGRDSNFFDVVADIGGVLLFIVIASLTRRHHKEDKERPES
ncbi:MAG: VanZ family protein [Bacteroidota bacterium]